MFSDDDSGLNLFAQALLGAIQQHQQQQQQQQGSNDTVKLLAKAAIEGDASMCRNLMRRGISPRVKLDNELTALHLAAHQGHVAAAQALVEGGADINAVDSDGDTAIMVATMQNECEVVLMLLRKRPDLSIKNKKRLTANDYAFLKRNASVASEMQNVGKCFQFNEEVHASVLTKAAQDGTIDLIKFWIDNNPNSRACNFRFDCGRTLLFIAALNGHILISKYLIDKGADAEVADEDGNTPLFCSAQNGHDEVLKLLLRRSRINRANKKGRTAIYSAICNDRQDALKLLLNAGADVDLLDGQGLTPLACALISNRADTIVGLVAGRTKNFSYSDKNDYSYAHLAVMARRLRCLKTLRSFGIMLDSVSDTNGETPLLAACQTSNADIVEYLLTQGCNADHQNHNGVSPVLRAAHNSSFEVVELLVKHKAKLDLSDKSGDTALLCAAKNNKFKILQLLHKNECSLRARNNQGKTVTHYAAKNSNMEMLRYLHHHGVSLDKTDARGLTPLMELAGSEDPTVSALKLLLECGCNKDARDKNGRDIVQIAKSYGNRNIVAALTNDDSLSETVKIRPSPPRKEPSASSSQASSAATSIDKGFTDWNFLYDDNNKKTPIGSGGFGKVYKAYTDKHQFVAVKVVKPMGENDPEARRQAYEQEKRGIELLRNINHPNIVCFLKAEEDGNCNFYIFTELLSGLSIYDIMKQQRKAIDGAGIKKFTKEICSALSHLHEHEPPIVHRDLKSSNIMVTNSGQIKLIDFGLAREIFTNSSLMLTNVACGTLYFMAPEIFDDDRPVYNQKTDIWALGCTVYEMATSQPPNASVRSQYQLIKIVMENPMPNLADNFSAELRDFYRVCVAKKPTERPTARRLHQHHALFKTLI